MLALALGMACACREPPPSAPLHLLEPSGLALVGVAADGTPWCVAVDDEQPAVFVVSPTPSGLRVAARLEPLVARAPEDLEAICHDGRTGWVYAVPSHRQEDEDAVLATLRFRIEGGPGADARIVEASELRLGPGILRALRTSGVVTVEERERGHRIDGRPWWKREKGEQPYALEVEGAVCGDRTLWLGLKTPTAADGAPLLLAYDLERDLEAQTPRVQVLRGAPTGPYGVSALALQESPARLAVALNPLGDFDEALDEALGSEHGHSLLLWVRPDGDGWSAASPPREASRVEAKLEGLELVRVSGRLELWQAYDGDAPALVRRVLTDGQESERSSEAR